MSIICYLIFWRLGSSTLFIYPLPFIKIQPKAGTTAVSAKKKLACKPMGGLHQRKKAKAAGVQPLPEPDDETESEKSIMDESEFDDCINEPNENQSRNKVSLFYLIAVLPQINIFLIKYCVLSIYRN